MPTDEEKNYQNRGGVAEQQEAGREIGDGTTDHGKTGIGKAGIAGYADAAQQPAWLEPVCRRLLDQNLEQAAYVTRLNNIIKGEGGTPPENSVNAAELTFLGAGDSSWSETFDRMLDVRDKLDADIGARLATLETD